MSGSGAQECLKICMQSRHFQQTTGEGYVDSSEFVFRERVRDSMMCAVQK